MLWHKSWIEVRFRFALSVVLAIYSLYMILGVVPGEVQAKFPNLPAFQIGAKIWKIFVAHSKFLSERQIRRKDSVPITFLQGSEWF